MEWGPTTEWRRRGYWACAGAAVLPSLHAERPDSPDKSQLNELFPNATILNNIRNLENPLGKNLGDSYDMYRNAATTKTDKRDRFSGLMYARNQHQHGAAEDIKKTKQSLNLEPPAPEAGERGRRSEFFPAFVGIANLISGFFNNITGAMSFQQTRPLAAKNPEQNNFSAQSEKDKPDFKFGPQNTFSGAGHEDFPEEDFLFTPWEAYECSPENWKVPFQEDLYLDSEPKDSGFDEGVPVDLDASPPMDEVDSILSFSRRDSSINSPQAIQNKTQDRSAQSVVGGGACRAPRDLVCSAGPEMDPAEQCRGKMAQIQHILHNKPTEIHNPTKKNFPFTRFRPRAKKVFVDAKSVNVEDSVESFAPESLARMQSAVTTEFVNVGVVAKCELVSVETLPKVKLEPADGQTCVTVVPRSEGNVMQKDCLRSPKWRNPTECVKIDKSIVIAEPVSLDDISVKSDVTDILSAGISVRTPEIKRDSEVVDESTDLGANRSQHSTTEQFNEKAAAKCELIADKLESVSTDANKTCENSCTDGNTLLENIVTAAPDCCENKAELISNCEDKVSKLKALLSERKKNNRDAQRSLREADAEMQKADTRRSPDRPVPVASRRPNNKHHKNPNRLDAHNQKRKQLRRNINEDMCFTRDVDSEQTSSSVEDSPKIVVTPPDSDGFNEIRGRFSNGSTSESDDSFVIVLSDRPAEPRRSRLPSDCGSEDSFIICFEDDASRQPSCFTSGEVFSSSDSEVDSDSDSGIRSSRLGHAFSHTVSDLTDESLYGEDAACESVRADSEEERESEEEQASSGLLLTEQKKLARRGLPQKKVSFSEAPPRVHVMRVWAFAARQARAGRWDKVVADRDRFKRRIADVDMAISWVLKRQHRARVKFQRFMPWWHAQRRQEQALRKVALLRGAEEEARAGEVERERSLEEDYARIVAEHYARLCEEDSSLRGSADVEGLGETRDRGVGILEEICDLGIGGLEETCDLGVGELGEIRDIGVDELGETCDLGGQGLGETRDFGGQGPGETRDLGGQGLWETRDLDVRGLGETLDLGVESRNAIVKCHSESGTGSVRISEPCTDTNTVDARGSCRIDNDNVNRENELNNITLNKCSVVKADTKGASTDSAVASRHFNPQRSANMKNNLYFSKVLKYDRMSARAEKLSTRSGLQKSNSSMADEAAAGRVST